jgi:hypothetical protein
MLPVFEYVDGGEVPVISDEQRMAEVGYGFEGGRVVKQNGTYWLFTAEFKGLPINANMRIAVWNATKPSGPWQRSSIIAESRWNSTCTDITGDLQASTWAPFPVFDHDEQRWHVHYVGYACDLTWVVRAGIGNLFGVVSTVSGIDGIGGPYIPYEGNAVVIGPNATAVNSNRWGDLSGGHLML